MVSTSSPASPHFHPLLCDKDTFPEISQEGRKDRVQFRNKYPRGGQVGWKQSQSPGFCALCQWPPFPTSVLWRLWGLVCPKSNGIDFQSVPCRRTGKLLCFLNPLSGSSAVPLSLGRPSEPSEAVDFLRAALGGLGEPGRRWIKGS